MTESPLAQAQLGIDLVMALELYKVTMQRAHPPPPAPPAPPPPPESPARSVTETRRPQVAGDASLRTHACLSVGVPNETNYHTYRSITLRRALAVGHPANELPSTYYVRPASESPSVGRRRNRA